MKKCKYSDFLKIFSFLIEYVIMLMLKMLYFKCVLNKIYFDIVSHISYREAYF